MRAARPSAVWTLACLLSLAVAPGCSDQDADQPAMGSIKAPKGDFGFAPKDQEPGKNRPRLPVSGK